MVVVPQAQHQVSMSQAITQIEDYTVTGSSLSTPPISMLHDWSTKDTNSLEVQRPHYKQIGTCNT